jgi:hypothetical protein
MARYKLPNGSQEDQQARVENGAGDLVYIASLNFAAGKEIKPAEKLADEAAENVATALRGAPRDQA